MVAAEGAAQVSKPGPFTTPCGADWRIAAGLSARTARAAPVTVTDDSMERASPALVP